MDVQQTIKLVGLELVQGLRNREPIKSIEDNAIQSLSSIEDLSLLISGCNRSGLGGENIVQRNSDPGRYVVVLNPLDGHVNYLRGGRTFAASISMTDTVTGKRYSLLYGGVTNEVFEFCEGVEVPSRPASLNKSVKPVIGIGELIALSSEGIDQMRQASLRSIGSTSLSILGILRGEVDLFIVKTKMWNVYWAMQLAHAGLLRFENLSDTYQIAAWERKALATPLKSLYLVCYRNLGDRERFSALISDFQQRHDLEFQPK